MGTVPLVRLRGLGTIRHGVAVGTAGRGADRGGCRPERFRRKQRVRLDRHHGDLRWLSVYDWAQGRRHGCGHRLERVWTVQCLGMERDRCYRCGWHTRCGAQVRWHRRRRGQERLWSMRRVWLERNRCHRCGLGTHRRAEDRRNRRRRRGQQLRPVQRRPVARNHCHRSWRAAHRGAKERRHRRSRGRQSQWRVQRLRLERDCGRCRGHAHRGA